MDQAKTPTTQAFPIFGTVFVNLGKKFKIYTQLNYLPYESTGNQQPGFAQTIC